MTLPQGFRFAGVSCGIKKDAQRHDLSLIVADRPAVAAGVYTQNLIFAAPVEWDRQRTPTDRARVVVVNSGNANACTGERGMEDTREMARLAAAAVGADADQALVMSTGIIGHFLPLDKIRRGIEAATPLLKSDEPSFLAAAKGIITTDRDIKVARRSLTGFGAPIQLAGMAKGAGMIGPRMATMLAVVMTDAQISPATAQRMLSEAVDVSFNSISVEGHMSTNDTVLLLASGASDCRLDNNSTLAAAWQDQLTELCIELAKMIPDDGEGATHLIQITVEGCRHRDDARRIARTVADSPLVKTAIHGSDPNWGRIVSAAGYAGVPFRPDQLQLYVNDHLLYQHASPCPFDAAEVSQSIRDRRLTDVRLQLAEGNASATFWTSDLTVDYVKFNSDYHT